MKRHILLIPALSILMLAPAVQQQVYGAEMNNPAMKENVIIVSDLDLKAAAKDALASDIDLARFANIVVIKVDKGEVTLSGVVDSAKAKANIESKIKNIVGVKKVINNLEVKS